MRFPWLQVDADFLATGAGDLAELLRTSGGIPAEAPPISEAEAGWAMVRLWGWAISKAESPETLGLLADEDMQRLAERAAGWRGAPGAFLAALLKPAVGLAQREEGGAVRLSGMERYASTLRRMEADRVRKSGKTPKELRTTSGGTPAELLRKTQTQTQKDTSASQATAGAAPPILVVQESQPEKPKRAPNTTAMGEFLDWARAEVKPRLPPDGMDPAKGLTTPERMRLGEAVKLHGLETVKVAFRLFTGWEVAAGKGYSVGFFANQWENWVRQAKATTAPAARPQTVGRGSSGQTCSGCGEDGEGGQFGGAFLGYDCGCARAWQGAGLPYTDAEEWARKRRAGRAA